MSYGMPDSQRSERILIVGGGLVGACLSIYLARRGYRVEIFDKNDDPRHVDVSARRSSINLSLSERGLLALDRVRMRDRVRALAVSTTGRVIHDAASGLTYQSYGPDDVATYSIMRNDLNQVLLETAEELGVRCVFNAKCVDLDLESCTAHFAHTRTGRVHEEQADRIFGADGVYSAVRLRLQRLKRFNFSQRYLEHGYKELHVPATARGGWTQHTDAVHLWPRGDYMLLGLPNTDGSFVCSLHLPLEGDPAFATLVDAGKLHDFFERSFPDVVTEIPDLSTAFFQRPVDHFVSVRCYPWCFEDKIALIGDSAHAIFPFYAQGTNAGFEDCMALDEALDEYDDDWGEALAAYQARRKPNADAISEMSEAHYHEIRDLVGRPRFQLIKRLEQRLSEIDGERFSPLYTMVTFTSIPYAEAMRRGREQRQLIEHLARHEGIEEKSDREILLLAEAAELRENRSEVRT